MAASACSADLPSLAKGTKEKPYLSCWSSFLRKVVGALGCPSAPAAPDAARRELDAHQVALAFHVRAAWRW